MTPPPKPGDKCPYCESGAVPYHEYLSSPGKWGQSQSGYVDCEECKGTGETPPDWGSAETAANFLCFFVEGCGDDDGRTNEPLESLRKLIAALGLTAKDIFGTSNAHDALVAALEKIVEMNVQYAVDRYGDATMAEPYVMRNDFPRRSRAGQGGNMKAPIKCCGTCHWWGVIPDKDGKERRRNGKAAVCTVPEPDWDVIIPHGFGSYSWQNQSPRKLTRNHTTFDHGDKCPAWVFYKDRVS